MNLAYDLVRLGLKPRRGRVSANPRDDEKRGRETRPGTFYLIAVVLSRVSGLCPDQVAFV